ncbi:glycosyltransferase family 2 protein [Algoriphagus aestuariicola]|jgi:teichuronic acid biosynthesis glycosyltransferase TuaG|uniref:Glycosyltransferase family 2 protein n=1 Tax=Algoriphagus aestuariicola TaxID=1852016 RepID=A0ABS3BKU2_9BACT|nr:glycosyltransferase family 2 protein [Algoriphagus aestuariicola]MBN7799915.1 glycosyltransferase family 2 protein [Algoriphagus aestuariicola]
MKQNPLVSIVVPVFNTEKFVGATIESVQAQSYSNWELILVDDCSRDRSVEICTEYRQKDPRIRIVAMPKNKGALEARNEGIRNARGRFLCFLDSDDTYEPEKLNYQVEFMMAKNVPVSFTMYQRISESGNVIALSNTFFRSEFNHQQLLGNPAFSIITLMVDRDKVDVPIVEAGVIKAEDYVFHLMILKQGFVAHGIPVVLSNYRIREGSRSNSFFGCAKDMWKVLVQIEKLSFIEASFYFSRYLLKGAWKRLALSKQLILLGDYSK